MTRITYKEAEGLIMDAYFKDEIQPMEPCFCFCGTLNRGDHRWSADKNGTHLHYTFDELKMMETVLLRAIPHTRYNDYLSAWIQYPDVKNLPEYEDALFEGMSDALDVLRSIHIGLGEDIEYKSLEKRELKIVTNN